MKDKLDGIFLMLNLRLTYSKIALLGLFCFGLGFSSCSKKVTNPKIERLQNQQTLLDLNSKLNSLNLKLEKKLVDVHQLTEKVKDANKDASASADKAHRLSKKLSENPGDPKLANKASRASRRAAKDAEKATKINEKLGDTNDEVKDYQKEIKDTEEALKDLKTKIEFRPNE